MKPGAIRTWILYHIPVDLTLVLWYRLSARTRGGLLEKVVQSRYSLFPNICQFLIMQG